MPHSTSQLVFHWKIRDGVLETGRRPLLMGIVNATPDSFSDGGQFLATSAAVEHALRLAEEGADLLDIGGESTRPGAEIVPEDVELKRVLPVLKALCGKVPIPISIDTSKAVVAEAALEAGAHIVNDITGLRGDPEMIEVCSRWQAGVVCMHMQGTPQTMQHNPQYGDVVAEIRDFFRQQQEHFLARGLTSDQFVWDPGIGFGKTAFHNLQLLSSITQLRSLGRPLLIGHSRKGFLKKIVGRELDDRLAGTIGVTLALAMQGADIIRVHDIAANRDALAAFWAIQSPG